MDDGFRRRISSQLKRRDGLDFKIQSSRGAKSAEERIEWITRATRLIRERVDEFARRDRIWTADNRDDRAARAHPHRLDAPPIEARPRRLRAETLNTKLQEVVGELRDHAARTSHLYKVLLPKKCYHLCVRCRIRK